MKSATLNRLMKLGSKELHNALTAENPDNPDVVATLKAAVVEERARTKANKAAAKRAKQGWRRVINTLDGARRVSKAKQPRNEALDAYSALLDKLSKRLRGFRDLSDQSPAQVAADKDVPNRGEHWVDWVPQHMQAAFQQSWADAYPEQERQFVLFNRREYIQPKSRKKPKVRVFKALTDIQIAGEAVRVADARVAVATFSGDKHAYQMAMLDLHVAIEVKRELTAKRNREKAKVAYHKAKAKLDAFRAGLKSNQGETK